MVGNEERGVRSPCAGGLFGGRWLILKTVCVQPSRQMHLSQSSNTVQTKKLEGQRVMAGPNWSGLGVAKSIPCSPKGKMGRTTSRNISEAFALHIAIRFH